MHENKLFFFGLKSPFSNFHPAKFHFDGDWFISSEQFIMFKKALLFRNGFLMDEILAFNQKPLATKFLNGEISSADIIQNDELCQEWKTMMTEIKHLGRTVQNFNKPVWAFLRKDAVFPGIEAKFIQNPELKTALLNTGTKMMVEASPYDKEWGIGLNQHNAMLIPEEHWLGTNLQGKILDEIKSKMMKDDRFWYGDRIISLPDENCIFVFGSNPEGRHGAGAALHAHKHFGAIYGQGKGRMGNSYAIITKNLTPNFIDKNGVCYEIAGPKSIPKSEISNQIKELYQYARGHTELKFYISYSKTKNLNGWSAEEMENLFISANPPSNIVFHESYKPAIERRNKFAGMLDD